MVGMWNKYQSRKVGLSESAQPSRSCSKLLLLPRSEWLIAKGFGIRFEDDLLELLVSMQCLIFWEILSNFLTRTSTCTQRSSLFSQSFVGFSRSRLFSPPVPSLVDSSICII